jgi:predicted nuclease of predicted toxin-antitoxin system
MRIVLDACVPAGFARFLSGHDVATVRQLFGTSDIDDGPLLDQLAGRCDVFITVDKRLPFQQSLRGRSFPVILLRAHSNSLEHLAPLAAPTLVAARQAKPGECRIVGV